MNLKKIKKKKNNRPTYPFLKFHEIRDTHISFCLRKILAHVGRNATAFNYDWGDWGVDYLHILFGKGVRRIKFSFKELSVTDISNVHSVRG